jgi:serine O-acetyltransferase
MEHITAAIIADLQQGRDIDRPIPICRTDRACVAKLTDDLLQILFPGGFPDEDTLRYHLASTHRELSGLLASLLSDTCRAQQTCREFFRAIVPIRELVQTDVQAAFDGDPAATGKEEIILAYPGLSATAVYRLAHELYKLGVPLLPRMMTEYAHSVTGIDIHPGARIGHHFFIDHGTGIVIGQTTVIGNFVKLYQGVTLGGLSTRGGQALGGSKRHPTIEDGVTVYANATILGGDTVIGQGCVIGANAFLIHSVAPGTTVRMEQQPLRFHYRRETGE